MNTEQANIGQAAGPSTPWYVLVSVTNMETGEAVPCARHDCRDMLEARTLLTELRELAADLTEFLPGLTVTGYELAEPKLQSFAEMIEAGDMREEDKIYWRGIIAEGDFLGDKW